MSRMRRTPWRTALRQALRSRGRERRMLLPERLTGAVYGHLVGDALGVPYEFQPAERIGEVEWRGHGTYDQPPGTWSDDGALMLALLDSLLTVGFDTADQARRALEWQETGAYAAGGEVFDIGSATSAALARLRDGTAPEQAGAVDALGNGSLMRVIPVPLVFRATGDEELVTLAARASRVTHGSAEAQIACALYALIVRRVSWTERTTGSMVLADARRALRSVLGGGRSARLARGRATRDGRRHTRRLRGLDRAGGQGARRGQLLVCLGRIRSGSRLPDHRHHSRALRQRHGYHGRDRRRSGRHLLGHRRHPVHLAPRPARSAHPPGAGRPARGDGRFRVGRHALAHLRGRGRWRWTSSTSRAPTWGRAAVRWA